MPAHTAKPSTVFTRSPRGARVRYTDRERAALAWTEALTLISETHAPDDVYEEVHRHFDELEIANLTMAIVTINGWNRNAIGFRMVPGAYQPKAAQPEPHAVSAD